MKDNEFTVSNLNDLFNLEIDSATRYVEDYSPILDTKCYFNIMYEFDYDRLLRDMMIYSIPNTGAYGYPDYFRDDISELLEYLLRFKKHKFSISLTANNKNQYIDKHRYSIYLTDNENNFRIRFDNESLLVGFLESLTRSVTKMDKGHLNSEIRLASKLISVYNEKLIRLFNISNNER